MSVQQKHANDSSKPCWYCSDSLPVPHAMFTRRGGTGSSPYDSLNLSTSVGDDPDSVQHNRQLLKTWVPHKHMVSANQVHGNRVQVAEDIYSDRQYSQCDALVTNQPGIGLLVQQADCQAILLYDPVQKVIGAVHSGWRSSTLNIIGKTVTVLKKHFRVRPENIVAVISPSLGPCCAEFIHYRDELPPPFHTWQTSPNFFNFWAISKMQLIEAGISNKKIDISKICTECNTDFFSYRRVTKKGDVTTGRNGSLIVLPG